MVLAGPVEVPVNVRIQGQVDAKEQPQRAAQEARVVPISQAPGSCQVVLYGGENGGQQTAVQFLDGPPMSVLPGRYRVSTVCTFAYLVSASMGNADLLANPWITVAPGSAPAPIEIVARRGSGAIVGTVKLQQAPAGKITCIQAVPEGSPRDPAFVCVMNGDGTRFSFESPVPGEYKLYAFSNDQVEYSNREFLGGLSGGESVQVDEGAAAQVTITKVVQ